MGKLITEPQIAEGDDFYEALIDLHKGKNKSESAIINAKLILLLSNHIGDREVLDEAFAIATERS